MALHAPVNRSLCRVGHYQLVFVFFSSSGTIYENLRQFIILGYKEYFLTILCSWYARNNRSTFLHLCVIVVCLDNLYVALIFFDPQLDISRSLVFESE